MIPEDDDLNAWLTLAREDLLPKMKDTAICVGLYPTQPGDEPDLKMALEIGLMVLMDKPILVIARPGQTISDHLRTIADRVIEASDPDEMQQQILEYLRMRFDGPDTVAP